MSLSQPSLSIARQDLEMDLTDASCRSDPEISVVPRALRAAPHSLADVESTLEQQLRDEVAQHRRSSKDLAGGLGVRWNPDLEAAIAPSLFSYETERCKALLLDNPNQDLLTC